MAITKAEFDVKIARLHKIARRLASIERDVRVLHDERNNLLIERSNLSEECKRYGNIV